MGGERGDARWASGAAVALVAALSAVLAHLSLRAASTGPAPGLPAVLLGGALLTLALWPLAARTTRVGALAAVLVTAQFGSHALALVAAGQSARDPRALICCPAADQVRPGPLGALTANAGWVLVAAQLAACVLLAVAVRAGRETADLLTYALELVRATVDAGRVRLTACLLAVRLVVPVLPAHGLTAIRPTPARALGAGRMPARRATRRGPPLSPALAQAGSGAAVARSFLPAAG